MSPSAFPSTASPSASPLFIPTALPTSRPRNAPSGMPTTRPSPSPVVLTTSPSLSHVPTSESTQDPSSKPSMVPSTSPSVSPSGTPSFSPGSLFACYALDLVCSLRLLNPDVSSSSALVMSSMRIPVRQDSGTSAWNITYDSFALSTGSSLSFTGAVGGRRYGSVSYSKPLRPVSTIRHVVSTGILYDDSPLLEVVYQLRDAAGSSSVSTDSLSIRMSMSMVGGNLISVVSCGGPDSNGIGRCSGSVDAGWFSYSGNRIVSVVVSAWSAGLLAQSLSSNSTLWRIPSYPSLTGVAMVLSLPHHPIYPTDSFTVYVSANTNGNALTAWVLSLYYDPGLLTLSSVKTSSLYTSAVSVSSPGKVTMSTSGVSPGTSNAAVTGDDVAVVSVEFVLSGAVTVTGVLRNVTSLFVNSLVNSHTLSYASNMYGAVHDARDGAYRYGSITIGRLGHVGILATTTTNMLLNSAPLVNTAVPSTVLVQVVSNRAGVPLVDVSGMSTCKSSDSNVLAVVSCNVAVTSEHTSGSSTVVVSVSLVGLEATVPFLVWYPSTVTVLADDDM